MNLNENNTINLDTFSNDKLNDIDGRSNVATYHAAAGSNSSGGSLIDSGLFGSSSTVVSITDYLARPKLLYSGEIDDYIQPIGYQFAYDFLALSDIQSKMQYHNLVRGSFELKLVVTTLPYATGIVGLSSSYMSPESYGAESSNLITITNNIVQKTHCDLDLASTTQAILSIPFHFRQPYIKNTDPNIGYLQKLIVWFYTKTIPQNTNASTPVTIAYKIYCSLKDAELCVPAPIVGSYTSETLEAMNGPISYPASVVSRVAKVLSSEPVIGPFAMAFDIGATAIGKIAKLFGFSRPRDLSKPCYPHQPWGASGIGEERAKNLTIDPMQQVTIDPSVFGERGDNLSFHNTIMRYGMVDIWTWTQLAAVGDTVLEFPITPTLEYRESANLYSPNALSYSSILFDAWRGDIVYKITIPANRFVRGKLRVFWSPTATFSSINIVSNNSLSVLLDLTMTTEVELTIPMLSESLYKGINPHMYIGMSADTTTTLSSNGWLHFIVEEPLMATNTAWTAQIIVEQKAGENFELAIPTEKHIGNILFGNLPMGPPAYNNLTIDSLEPPATNIAVPQGNYFAIYTAESNDVNPMYSQSTLLYPTFETDKPMKLQIGEDVKSLRMILKRLSWFRTIQYTPDTDEWVTYFLPLVPPVRYFVEETEPLTQTLGYDWVNTPISYLSKMFAGVRGSVRYTVFDRSHSTNTNNEVRYVTRGYRNMTSLKLFVLLLRDLCWVKAYFAAGTTMFRKTAEPIQFDIPYQAFTLFHETAKIDDLNNDVYGAQYLLPPTTGPQHKLDIFVSAGEDFQCVIYNGPPLINLYTII
jgi:hypothetical protein